MSEVDKKSVLEERGPRFEQAMEEILPAGFFEDGHLKGVLLAKARVYKELGSIFTTVETYATKNIAFASSQLG